MTLCAFEIPLLVPLLVCFELTISNERYHNKPRKRAGALLLI